MADADTPDRRAAALNLGHAGVVLPIPDGQIDVRDRAHLLGAYDGSPDGEIVIAPNVEGLTNADAIIEILAVGAVVAYAMPTYSETVAAGRVLDQSPSPGSQISLGATITLVISLGSVYGGSGLSNRSDYGLIPETGSARYVMRPGDSILIDFPWASRLAGETIASVAYELPDGLANAAQVGTGSYRQVRVSSGEAGRFYRVIGKIVTSAGRQLSWLQQVLVQEG